jgi:hypothetical protein
MEDAARTSRLSLSLENSATCEGQGIGDKQHTFACCQGKDRILVAQPPKKCARCSGSGKPEAGNSWSVEYCVICREQALMEAHRAPRQSQAKAHRREKRVSGCSNFFLPKLEVPMGKSEN